MVFNTTVESYEVPQNGTITVTTLLIDNEPVAVYSDNGPSFTILDEHRANTHPGFQRLDDLYNAHIDA